jgi:hypothetical protein
MAIKYINIIPDFFPQIDIFGLKTNHLATLVCVYHKMQQRAKCYKTFRA